MSMTIRLHGVQESLMAFRELPRRVGFKHLRIALNAGGGIVKNRYASIVPRETGLLSKSIGVKVTIPDASYNTAHHGRPATAVVGVKRRAGRMMRVGRKGKLMGFGAAQRELVAERKRLAAGKVGRALDRERAAVRFTLASVVGARYRSPSRYAHLAGPRRRGKDILASAVAQTKSQVIAKVSEKLAQGIEIEARNLAPRQPALTG